MEKVGIILINYRDYASRFLADCITSIRAQQCPDFLWQLYMVDNASSAESQEYLKKHAPEATLICNTSNDGFAKGNNDGIKRAFKDGCDYVFALNMDTVVAKDALAQLIATVRSDEHIGAVQARIMLADKRTIVNSLGNVTHFLGFGFSKGYREVYKSKVQSTKSKVNIAYPSGAAVLFTRTALEQVGLFDEELWMYNEDQDLGWRLWLAGYTCVLAPDAVVYHKYNFSRSVQKYYWMDRNRVIVLLKNYHLLTLLLVAPAFLIMEVGLILFSLKTGWLKEKLRVWWYFLQPRTWHYVKRARARVQRKRQVSDRRITKLFSGTIWYQEVDDVKLRLINPIFNAYWRIVCVLILW